MSRRTARGPARRLALALAISLAGGGLAACGTMASPLPYDAAPRATTVPATTAPTPAPTPAPCNPRASVPPLPAIPPPGQRGKRIAEIEKEKVLRIGLVAESPPLASMDWYSGKLVGFEVDLASKLGQVILGADAQVEIRAVDTRDRARVVNEGGVDIIVGTMTMTCARKELVRFSGVYLEAALRILVPRNAGLNNIGDLSGRRVCASEGSTSIEKIRSLPGFPAGRASPIPVTRVAAADCLAALQRGEVDAIATDNTILAGMAQEDPTVEVLGTDAFDDASPAGPTRHAELAELDEPYGMAIARNDLQTTGTQARRTESELAAEKAEDDRFLAFLNTVLLTLMRNGEWDELYNRYLRDVLGEGYGPPTVIQPGWPDGIIDWSLAGPHGEGT